MSPVESKLYAELRRAGERQGWWDASNLLVALSGGGDSMALLELLRRFYSGGLAAAHLEHGFRGEPSLADAVFVAGYCEKIGIPCFVKHGDVLSHRLPGESAEMAGRRARYEFFFELLDREGLSYVATAHNSGDVVETMLLNLFRGTGIKGLAGIAGRRGRVVRPVIACSRDDLRQFLADSGIQWREDETNAENHYLRNRIRNQLLPWLRSNLNESADGVLLGLAGECEAAGVENERDAAGLLLWVKRRSPIALAAWDTATARRLPPVSLSSAIRAQGRELSLPTLDRRRLDELRRLMSRSGWRFQWADDIEVCGAGGIIGWIRRGDLIPPPPVRAEIAPGEVLCLEWGGWRVELRSLERGAAPFREKGAWSAQLPADGACAVAISSLADTSVGGAPVNSVILREIPWWSRPRMPILQWTGKNIGGSWIPGILGCMQDNGSYVIIAKVFCCGKLAVEA
ncbi:MAG: tRNA lysidine(34) synthetase TilS [Synergistaceae bacterium]|jgi:tRNA(Ile)-lysidine synthase|nr:tRNA lysidine(34) synthetase TilS [Synergistaceae bacterium]